MTADLDKLKAYFDQHRQEWINAGHDEAWALIGEEGLQGFYDYYDEAVYAAAKAFGQKPCLIQQVLPEERTETIQHVFWSEWAATKS